MLASGEEGCSGLFEWEHSQGNQAGCVLPPIGQHQVQHGPMLQSDGAILEHLAGSLQDCKERPHVSNSADKSIGGPDQVEATIGCSWPSIVHSHSLLGPSAEGVVDLVQEVGGGSGLEKDVEVGGLWA